MDRHPHAYRHLLLATALYATWVITTYLLEGRRSVLLEPDPTARATYTLVANVLIGTLGAAALTRHVRERTGAPASRFSLAPGAKRRAIALTTAGLMAALLLAPVLQDAPARAVANAAAQVFTTSVAEVLVCWMVVGAAVETTLRPRGRALATLAAIVAAVATFDLYHLAHSPPFNAPATIRFLTLPALVTSAFFFLGRDVHAAVLAQTALGAVGVLGAIGAEPFAGNQPALWALAAVSLLALVGATQLAAAGGTSRAARRARAAP